MPGDLLESIGNHLGPGKAIEAGPGDTIVLEYFDSPGVPPDSRHRENVPRAKLRRHHLSVETRVFWEGEAGWNAGRVQSIAPDGDIEIRAKDWDGFVEPQRLYVRWSKPLLDPSTYLRAGVLDSPHHVEMRMPILSGISKQLGASRGMPGLLTVAAELHAHQLIAARRVLEDHRQRYLLADEVGLGKTIETLLVLRQLLLDHPNLSVRCIVPESLVGQWQAELEQKLAPHGFPHATFNVDHHGSPHSWSPADILIVDEAHNVVGGRHGDRLRQVAHDSERLLLLSATPALHNEDLFLQMLNLLDPDVYSAEDVEGFRSRLEQRQLLGRAMLGLHPDVPSFLLAGAISSLRQVLRGEPELLESLDQVEAAEGEERTEQIANFSSLVADVFQVHRRMVRTRRTDDLVRQFPVGDRGGVERLEFSSSALEEAGHLLERMAQRAAIAAESDRSGATAALADAIDAFPDEAAMIDAARGTALHSSQDVPGGDGLVEDLADMLTLEARADDRVVIFTPTVQLARSLAAAIADFLPGKVATITSADNPDQVARDIGFFTKNAGLWLVCDRTAEEGVNLQAANLMVHVGLPADCSRLEQRIGRVDRWVGRGNVNEWRALEVVPEGGLANRWSTVVDEGFGVHSASVASLQRAVEETSREALLMLADSTRPVREVLEHVIGRLEAERTFVREQDAIDAIMLGAEDRRFVEAVLTVDAAAEDRHGFGPAFHDLMAGGAGNLRFISAGDPGTGVGRYEIGDPTRTLLPPLVPTSRLLRDFHPISHLGWAARREVAIATDATPLRAGAQIVAATESFLRDDDRGRSWGMWRHDPGYEGTTQIWWRVDVLLRPEVPVVPSGVDASLMQRTADGSFPPVIARVWITGGQVAEPDAETRVWLDAPYRKTPHGLDRRVDRSLAGSRLRHLHGRLDRDLADVVDLVAEEALTSIPSNADHRAAIDKALLRLRRRSLRRRAALLRRKAADQHEQAELDAELKLHDQLSAALEDAVRAPTTRIDSIGVLVLSAEWPFADE